MSRPPFAMPRQKLTTNLPADFLKRLNQHLYAEGHGRILTGAYQRFICERGEEFFMNERFDLSIYGLPKGSLVSGSPATIRALQLYITFLQIDILYGQG